MQPPTESSRSSIASRVNDYAKGRDEASNWTEHEERTIQDSFGEGSPLWSLIEDQLPGRSAQEVRHHWLTTSAAVTVPKSAKQRSIRKFTKTGKSTQRKRPGAEDLTAKLGRWDPAEDECLLKAMRIHDRNWSACAKMIPAGDGKQCRARWMSLLVSTGRQQWSSQ